MNPQQIGLAALLAVLFPFIGSSVSAILEQDGFPQVVNDLIAWTILLLSAVASAYAANKLTGGGIDGTFTAIAGAVTLLLSGPMHALTPWTNWRDFLRSNIFAVVKNSPVVMQWSGQGRASSAGAPKPISLRSTMPPPTGDHSG